MSKDIIKIDKLTKDEVIFIIIDHIDDLYLESFIPYDEARKLVEKLEKANAGKD
jgi:hypothetical protein